MFWPCWSLTGLRVVRSGAESCDGCLHLYQRLLDRLDTGLHCLARLLECREAGVDVCRCGF